MSKCYLIVRVVTACLLLSLPFLSLAQNPVSGKVISVKDQLPVAGASVVVKGTATGSSTAGDGAFTIVAKTGDVLVVSGVGFLTKEVAVKGSSLEVALEVDARSLNEVVVTALGIKKDKKKLGYAVQEVKGEDLVKAREPNPINSLVGKVAGLTVGASAEMLAAPQLVLRGSGIGLFVVDGVPINSDTWNISPDDIESYTVLKGATASALYGSRGQYGAVMITTKRGSRDKRGYSIEFNSSTMFESGFNAIPKVQDEYGPGDHGKYAFKDGKGAGSNDGDYDVWGPKFEGQLIPQYDSPVDPVTGVRQGTPWVARGKDNLKRFLQTGLLSTNNIAVSSHGDKYDLRFSLSHTYQKGIVPNMKINITNFNISAGYKFSDKVRMDGYLNYNRQYTPNFPDVNYGPNSLIYNIVIWAGADWDVDQMRNYWQPGKEGVQSIYAEYQRYHNPWFMVKEWLRGHYKTDVNGYAKLTYEPVRHVELMARTQVTTYDLFRNEKMPFSAHPYQREEGRGDYREDKRTLFENNTDILATYTNKFRGDIDVKGSVGGNIRSFRYNSSFVTTDYLNVPGWYNFNNTRNPLRASNFTADLLTLSAYSYLDVSLNKYANISLTGRFDKLSTLPSGNNVYFYPSAALSTVVTDYVQLPEAISFLKLRGSYANVKGGLTASTIGATPQASYPLGYGSEYYSSYDGPSYTNSIAYTTPPVYNNQTGAYYSTTLNNPDIKPLSSTVYEVGGDVRFLNNKIGLDVTYFTTKDGPAIFTSPLSQTTGYTGALQNGITTKKTGWEVSLNATPITNRSGFSWNTMVNWSTFKEVYTKIYGDLTQLDIYRKIGTRVDQFVGSAFVKTPDGRIINDAGGRPIRNPVSQLQGYTNPDWVWSFINNVSYKNFRLGFQFDGRVGGHMVNYIQQQTYRGGRHINTVQGKMGEARFQDYKGVKSWVGEGVVVSNNTAIEYDNLGNVTNYAKLQFAPNTTPTYLQDYISFYYNTNEANLIEKTFAKLREVTLTYSLPQAVLGKTFMKQASISLIGRNLLYFSKYKDLDIDQYAGSQGSSSLQTPTAKRYGVNINITF
ncbi:SusC/RagA family TonB-linked outer membrane protein [Paraflavitalea sp. CAU 1676]|uniref:SusC/RagA family TonB-linked outer membrane protein n=1 Tax=Paraflavitalea sp. CAU 1676 TaxID=3032598 RepID=UPI0023DAEC5B|nr:SusC/RagA family TonB-linked outer membrane protein [Paraflavitalea sp. CAU 1676]MDF2187249.1 SusC/RagA family TonB-linked outer membrane protein [Paraflavitalea sp. CAU 1676]